MFTTTHSWTGQASFRIRGLTNVQVAASNNNTFAGGGLRQRRLRLGRTKREQFLDRLLGPWHSFIQWRWCGRRRGRFPALPFRTTFPRARADWAAGAHPLEMEPMEPTTHSWAGQASFRNRGLTNVQVAASNNNTFAGGGLRQRRLRLGRTKREQFLDRLLGPWHSFIQWRWCGRRRGRFPALPFRTTFPRARADRAAGAHPLEMEPMEPTTHSWAGQASFRNRGLTNVQVAASNNNTFAGGGLRRRRLRLGRYDR